MSDNEAAQVHLNGHLICSSPDELATVETYLPDHIRLTRAEPGCLSFDVTQTEDPMVWRVAECFIDRAAFEAHQRRVKASDWGRATAGIRRAYEVTGT
ncbi:putative quinol monooxygenase [Allosediminivita pacifica]|uniref:Quinol monooxygenase YgiN n=1 Tax=Allosediminivita pacifica TaxID=1267769 RepID=A0A2T6B9S4_9RHOB|nr:antibiotic biosynthesis monooxygenase [Allosediminivita pacifica]PTX52782.1 quinol monooxygenase YgiN [Allosediminivita pacifica]GGA95863.1 antibiotic biosynthesis monooxygenase [Allosediminivita pacifica]